jgi:hypothetical protein
VSLFCMEVCCSCYKATQTLNTSNESGLQVNREINYMMMSCHKNVRQNHNIKTAKRSLKMRKSLNIWEQ